MNSPLSSSPGLIDACSGLAGRRACERIRSRALLAAMVNSHGRNRRCGIELLGRLVDLEERLLEYVLGRRPVAQEPHQEMIELALVAADQLREAGLVAVAVVAEELLVGAVAGMSNRDAAPTAPRGPC